ncbi:MAG: hypothetical protein EGQ57_06340 [Alphaproteobacteria bacterium]|nr:hypothetical protein [Alphaproteobacteria bacterium]
MLFRRFVFLSVLVFLFVFFAFFLGLVDFCFQFLFAFFCGTGQKFKFFFCLNFQIGKFAGSENDRHDNDDQKPSPKT